MADGWRGILQRALKAFANGLEKKEPKRWTPEGQRIGIAIVIAVLATSAIWGFTAMYAGVRFERSHDLPLYVKPPVALDEQEKLPCDRGADNRASDLCAQWKAADAARKSAEWSVSAFFVNLCTLIGVGLGFWEARKSTIAANEQVKIARESLEKGARAWLGIALIPKTRFYVSDVAAVVLEAKLENTGNSPAYDVCIHTFMGNHKNGSEFDEPLDSFCDRVKFSEEGGMVVLPGQKKITEIYVENTVKSLKEFVDGVSEGEITRPFIYVCCTYKTSYSQEVFVTAEKLLLYGVPSEERDDDIDFTFLDPNPENWKGLRWKADTSYQHHAT